MAKYWKEFKSQLHLQKINIKGLVIANEGANFSAGANVAMIFMMAIEQDYDEIDMAIRQFQNTMMRVRYSGIPVVASTTWTGIGWWLRNEFARR